MTILERLCTIPVVPTRREGQQHVRQWWLLDDAVFSIRERSLTETEERQEEGEETAKAPFFSFFFSSPGGKLARRADQQSASPRKGGQEPLPLL